MPTRTPEELGLETGDAVMRDGQLVINPRPPAQITRIEQPQQQLKEIGGFDLATHQHHTPATSSVTGSHQDRAKAFNIRTKHVSFAAAGASIPLAIVGFGVPLFDWLIVMWVTGTYFSVWLGAFLWDQATSPDGVSWFAMLYRYLNARSNLRMSYDLIKSEQDHRHRKEIGDTEVNQ